MFALLSVHSPIGIHSLVNHAKTVYYTIVFYYDTATLHKQALSIQDKSSAGGKVVKVVNGCLHRCQRTRQSEYTVW